MVTRRVARAFGLAAAPAVAGLALACNALTGASSLGVCTDDCSELLSPDRIEGGSGEGSTAPPDGGDAGPILPATCTGNETACAGKVAAQCKDGKWLKTTCSVICTAGKCEPYPSCRNAAGTGCGAAESCCATAAVPGGTFKRQNSTSFAATISAFELDKFEVTVGRFRAFVDAGGVTKATGPAAGKGANPKIPNSGWVSIWDAFLPGDVASLRAGLTRFNSTWTDAPGANEHKPINNVSWFLAFAFCAWDGGRLPTYAEANYAAAGGSEQRYYPWSSGPMDIVISAARASYECNFSPPSRVCPASSCSDNSSSPCNAATCLPPAACNSPPCTGCALADIANVGSLPLSAGKWGHLDLSGNVGEMVLDDDDRGMPPGPCNDCAALPPTVLRGGGGGANPKLNASFIVVGGSWESTTTSLRTTFYERTQDADVGDHIGFRCAR